MQCGEQTRGFMVLIHKEHIFWMRKVPGRLGGSYTIRKVPYSPCGHTAEPVFPPFFRPVAQARAGQIFSPNKMRIMYIKYRRFLELLG